MSLQKYRADFARDQSDGAIIWYTKWMGGTPIAKVLNCRVPSLAGDIRVSAYAQAEPDTWFSVPAVCTLMGCRVSGYLTSEDDCIVFRHTYY